ncbi:hypothetical protein Y032_0189g1176 [Ancylostoma ceylanicum]|uniref:Uncharacterized protein n=1 Tax=Ancylostoma ceylanicum TaxID=53326 RepID=A0A016SQ47_9BILA|nr:hypothetical protein Y032_0189g1176 [Ancylostoma ceylanicum]
MHIDRRWIRIDTYLFLSEQIGFLCTIIAAIDDSTNYVMNTFCWCERLQKWRKKWIRRGSSDIPSMRNWPLFAFLTGLVFFFYVFYIYQAQSTEFAMTRTELEDQIQKVRNLKMEVFNAKAENERLKSSENTLKSEKDKFNKEKEECANSLRTCKLNAENLQTQAKKAEELTGVKEQQTKDLQAKIDALTKERDELAAKVLNQETLAKQLKAEVEKLQAELKQPKPAGASNVVAAPAVGGAAPAGGAAAAAGGGAAAGAAQVVAGGAGRRQRSLEVEERREEKSDDKQLTQAQAAQVVAPPQQPGDRVKLAVAAEQSDDDIDKPVVKGGDYEDKLAHWVRSLIPYSFDGSRSVSVVKKQRRECQNANVERKQGVRRSISVSTGREVAETGNIRHARRREKENEAQNIQNIGKARAEAKSRNAMKPHARSVYLFEKNCRKGSSQ